MATVNAGQSAETAVRELESAYLAYAAALQEVVELGEEAIPALAAALNHKKANPIAKALGYLMHLPAAEIAIPRLLDCMAGTYPIYPDALEAVVRAGAKAIPLVLDRVQESASQEDDEAVRNLLQVAIRLTNPVDGLVIAQIVGLLRHSKPHFRDAAADAVFNIGLPQGRPAIPELARLAQEDPDPNVRKSAAEALTRLR